MAPPKAKPEAPMHWSEVATKLKAINDQIEAELKAEAEQAAQPPAEPQTASAMLARAISGNAGNPLPLNGAALLRSAIANMGGGSGGTVNGGQQP